MPRSPLPEPLRTAVFRTDGPHGLSRRRRDGPDLRRPFTGVRSTLPTHADARADLLRRCREYLPLMAPGQCFSHETAALIWGMPLPRALETSEVIHVTTTSPARAPRGRGVVGHRALDPRIVVRDGLPVTDPIRTWTDLAQRIGHVDLVAVGDHMVLAPRHPRAGDDRPWATTAELIAVAESHRGRGAAALRAAAGRVRERVESRRETRLRVMLVDAGLPEPITGYRIEIEGVVFFLDTYYPEWRVAAEYDGEQHRLDDAQYEHDEMRVETIMRSGRALIRVRKRGLSRAGRAATIARVRRALRDAGWRG